VAFVFAGRVTEELRERSAGTMRRSKRKHEQTMAYHPEMLAYDGSAS